MTHTMLTLQSPVYTSDGPCGQIVAIVINPNTSRIEYLGVQPLADSERLHFVPISKIATSTDTAVILDLSGAEVVALPTLGQQPPRAATFQSNVSDLYLASANTRVRNLDGTLIGIFAGAITDTRHRIERLLLVDSTEVSVPIASIAYAEADGLAVRFKEREARA